MFCCRVEGCSWVVNWHIIPNTVGLRSERLPCPETAAPHSVQKTSKWGLITRPCWILPSNSTFVLVVWAKSPNYIAGAFHPACVLLNSAKQSETSVYYQAFLFLYFLFCFLIEKAMSLTTVASLQMTVVNASSGMSSDWARSWTPLNVLLYSSLKIFFFILSKTRVEHLCWITCPEKIPIDLLEIWTFSRILGPAKWSDLASC